MSQSEKNELVEQSDFQLDPGSALGRDFEILSPEAASALKQPFHGQCGDSDAEYNRLMKEAESTSKGPFLGGAPRPTKVVSGGTGKPTKVVQQK
jgi:hypothetical protein